MEDLLAKTGADIDFIKIDIEGGEKIVIPAMEKSFRTLRPIIFLSLHPRVIPRKDLLNVIAILQKYYRLYHIDGKTPLNVEKALKKIRHSPDSDILCFPS